MKATRNVLWLFCVGTLLLVPTAARAHGVGLEIGSVWTHDGESAYRAVADVGDTLPELGVGAAVTLLRREPLRLDATLAWSMTESQANVADGISTSLLEHAFTAGARLRWARFSWIQPYLSVRGGPAFVWYDAGDLESSDYALRALPAAGVDLVLPFSAIAPPALAPGQPAPQPSSAGLGVGLEVGYRFQTTYRLDADRPLPEDEDVAADAIPREGAHLGELSMSGWRFGVNLFGRF